MNRIVLATVSRILRNEVYLGTLVQGTKRKAGYKSKKLLSLPRDQWIRVENTHEAVIDPNTFDAAQQRIRKHTRSSGRGEAHVLAGKLRCADCANTMIKVSNGNKAKPLHYIQCATYAATRGKPECTKHSIRLDVLTAAVEAQIRRHVHGLYEVGDASRFEAGSDAEKRADSLKRDITSARQQIEQISAALRSLYLEKVDGAISPEQFEAMNDGFLSDRARQGRQVQLLEQRLAQLEQSETNRTQLNTAIRQLLSLDHIGRALYDLLIDTIEIGETDAASNTRRINIKWKI